MFYDPPSGEYVVYYAGTVVGAQPAQPTLLRFGTHALLDPGVAFAVSSSGNGGFRYTYDVSNGTRARQPIGKIHLPVYSDKTPRALQQGWTVNVAASTLRDLTAPATSTTTVDWTPNSVAQSITPGTSVPGFAVESSSLPGFITVVFSGATKSNEYNPAAVAFLPPDVRNQIDRVFKTAWDAKTRLVIGPRFSKDASQTEVAQNFSFGIQSLIRDGKLDANSPFVQAAFSLLSTQLESGGLAMINASSLVFCEKAKPGLETTIANALQTALIH